MPSVKVGNSVPIKVHSSYQILLFHFKKKSIYLPVDKCEMFVIESELSTYSSVNLWSQTTPVHDLSSQQNRHSKMSNAPSIALHRQYAKQRIERSLKHAQNNYFNTTRVRLPNRVLKTHALRKYRMKTGIL